jgi:ubiquinone/menaquinone biosynthesis C-methylase UbiE
MEQNKATSEVNVAALYTDMCGSQIYELIWGDNIHPGGLEETKILAEKAGINKDCRVLDICSGLGGPARFLARTYGCNVVGIDILETHYNESTKRTKEAGLDHLVSFRLANAMALPFEAASFDVVWGQDAWCHVPDKAKLIAEAARVLKKGGIIAFTDHLETEKITDELRGMMQPLAIPNLQTLKGYVELLEKNGFTILCQEDIGKEMGEQYRQSNIILENKFKNEVINRYGQEIYQGTIDMFQMLVDGVEKGMVSRGRIVARKN